MKQFVLDVLAFVAAFIGVLVAACFLLPGTRAKNSMLAHQLWIEKTLHDTPGGRIVFVGGSGCGNGISSEAIAKTFGRRVVNAGLHAGLGLVYQMKAVEQDVKKGDIVVLVPEYSNFSGTGCWGNLELFAMVTDIIPDDRVLLSVPHYVWLLQFVPAYATSKLAGLFKHIEKFKPRRSPFGDNDWDVAEPDATLPFAPAARMTSAAYADDVISPIREFKRSCEERGAAVLILPPAFQLSSFERQVNYIHRVTEELARAEIPFAVDPQAFALADNLFFETPYHLNLKGRKLRSDLMINALEPMIEKVSAKK